MLLLPALCVSWVAWQYLQLDGVRTVNWRPGERSPFVQSPLPVERVVREGGDFALVGDPVYVHILPPPGYWREMEIVPDMNARGQELFKIGLMVDAETGAMDLRTIQENQTPETFLLQHVDRENGAFKVIFSLPGVKELSADEVPLLHGLSVTFRK